ARAERGDPTRCQMRVHAGLNNWQTNGPDGDRQRMPYRVIVFVLADRKWDRAPQLHKPVDIKIKCQIALLKNSCGRNGRYVHCMEYEDGQADNYRLHIFLHTDCKWLVADRPVERIHWPGLYKLPIT